MVSEWITNEMHNYVFTLVKQKDQGFLIERQSINSEKNVYIYIMYNNEWKYLSLEG